ncbi:MAG TPA: DUF1592 domain-containing protein [Verrucomicrobiae bacterium]
MLSVGVWAENSCLLAAESAAATDFNQKIRPILEDYCFDCHGNGENRGGVALDAFDSGTNFISGRDVWWRVLKNLRAGLMPPAKKSQPTKEQKELIEQWIKDDVFLVNPANPDPGHVTIRRLNRVEYQNTIHDLVGVDYDTQSEFPPDDTGHGFDDIGEVLSMSPMLLEKYMVAAEKIIAQAVPTTPGVPPEQVISGSQFRSPGNNADAQSLSYHSPAVVSNVFNALHAGPYQLEVELKANENFVDNVFDYNKCRLIFRVDGKELLQQEFSREEGKSFHFHYNQTWAAGNHQLTFELQPLTPNLEQPRSLSLQVKTVTVRGPLTKSEWVRPENYARFFPKEVPESSSGRRAYARELLGDFARRAFRRPVDKATVNELADLAKSIYDQPGKTFEAGVAEAMIAVLASPRFIFREENVEPAQPGQPYALVDEYALASRLSYFLWSTMPDAELFQQAAAGTLRKNLSTEVARMLADKRAVALEKNFVGQWLQARDIETVPLEARVILERDGKYDPEQAMARKRFRDLSNRPELTKAQRDELDALRTRLARAPNLPKAELSQELRRAMRQETESVFNYILRDDRSLLELLDSDYTFLNGPLARQYGIPNVTGLQMRRVQLPPDSPRGGILTEGTVLAVTSNPTRTSPVKRGVFILDNILGTPPLPPPPNIPPLEDAIKGSKDHPPTLRESLAAHRENPLCASCHSRMDPLGLALENFNALGMWRDQEYNQPIDPAGQLATGEKFSNIKELKQVLVKNHAEDFYRTLTQKLLTYALGRGLDYYDVETVDQIVARIEKSGGKPSALFAGIIESAPFQKTRTMAADTATMDQPAAKPISNLTGENLKEKL